MREDNGNLDPKLMAHALKEMPKQKKPSEIIVPGLLEGLENVNRLVEPRINNKFNKNIIEKNVTPLKRA